MTSRRWISRILGLAAGLFLMAHTTFAGSGGSGVTWHFQVGVQYFSGMQDVMDAIEEQNFVGYDFDDFFIPVGLVVSPYAEFDFGLAVGCTLGPPSFVAIREDYYAGSWYDEADYFTFIMPIGLDVRYTLLREGPVSPYVRVGVRYPIAGGDFIDSATPGFNGGVGVEFMRDRRVGFGIEAGYDTSEVKIESRYGFDSKTVKPVQFTLSVFAVF